MQNKIKIWIILGIIAVAVLGGVGSIIHINNKGVRYEESLEEDLGNINKEKTRKYSLFKNMVEAIESYNKYEGETLTAIIAARNNPNEADANGERLISALVEQYPELKSNENYKTYLTETSVTENRIANYIEVYNKEVKSYRAWARSFPVNIFYHVNDSYEQWNDEKANIDIDGKLFNKE